MENYTIQQLKDELDRLNINHKGCKKKQELLDLYQQSLENNNLSEYKNQIKLYQAADLFNENYTLFVYSSFIDDYRLYLQPLNKKIDNYQQLIILAEKNYLVNINNKKAVVENNSVCIKFNKLIGIVDPQPLVNKPNHPTIYKINYLKI